MKITAFRPSVAILLQILTEIRCTLGLVLYFADFDRFRLELRIWQLLAVHSLQCVGQTKCIFHIFFLWGLADAAFPANKHISVPKWNIMTNAFSNNITVNGLIFILQPNHCCCKLGAWGTVSTLWRTSKPKRRKVISS